MVVTNITHYGPPSSPSPPPQIGVLCTEDIYDKTPRERMDLLLSGQIKVCNSDGSFDQNSITFLGTTEVEGICLGFDDEGDLMIEDDMDMDDPQYIDSTFFGWGDHHTIDKFKGKKIRFSYGVLVPGHYQIELI
jgi:hypothetical protein